MNYRLKQIAPLPVGEFLARYKFDSLDAVGDENAEIDAQQYFMPLDEAGPGTATFCYGGDKAGEKISRCKASLVITDYDFRNQVRPKKGQLVVFVRDVRLSVVNLLQEITEPVPARLLDVDRIPRSSYVGPNVSIESGVTIGENVKLIGNIYIYSNTHIGNNVVIKPNSVIGGQGFGYVPEDNKQLLFPHIGGVIIEDDVRIGSCTCIDRGALGNTILKRGCRIDNLVHIAHNVVVGENSLVIANAMIAGSVNIGANVQVAPSASVLQGLTIGNDSFIGLHSCVVKNVPEKTLVYGVPARAPVKKPESAENKVEKIPA